MNFVVKTYGQQKIIDTIGNYSEVNYIRDYEKKNGLADLLVSTDKFHIRFWLSNHVIDLIENKEGDYKAFVTFSAYEWVNGPEAQTNRIYSDTINMTKTQYFELYTLFKNSGINTIPTDKLIKGWMHGLDGETYIFESEDSTHYSYKSYWTPSMQDNLREAISIQNFADNADTIISLKRLSSDFYKKIPFECYTTGGMSINTKKLTIDEQRAYRKERDLYRQEHHIKDTVESD